MSKKEFNPQEWLQDNNTENTALNFESTETQSNKTFQQSEVEEIISRIEAKQLDIANAYSDWRDIGFAFATE